MKTYNPITQSRFLLVNLLVWAFLSLAFKNGDKIPDFEAKNQDGKTIKLSQFLGKPVILFFYPKDDTPGCTKEACNFRDKYSVLQKHDAIVLGVSTQGENSHQEFRKKYRLPFDLLVDRDGSVAKKMQISSYPLVGYHKRRTLLIDRTGHLFKYYESVDPAEHVFQLIEDLKVIEEKKGF